MERLKISVIVFLIVTSTFIIPVTITESIKKQNEHKKTEISELPLTGDYKINKTLSELLDEIYTKFIKDYKVNIPEIGSITIGTVILIISAIILFIISIIAAIKLLSNDKKNEQQNKFFINTVQNEKY